jgi:HSP20 family molecular chaperone IbpA
MLYTRTGYAFPQNLLRRNLAWARHQLMNAYPSVTPFSHQFQSQFPTNAPWGPQHQVPCCTPETDILELDDQYLLEIALPGVVLDDIELKAEEDCITVIAKRTPAMFEERAQFIRKELPVYLVRQFEFETPILHEQVEARMDRGILFVSVPKLEVALRVPVSAGSIEGHVQGQSLRTRVGSSNVNPKSETIRSGKEVGIK